MTSSPSLGGLTVHNWLLATQPREFNSKKTGELMTVAELRDPARLSNSLVLFLDGPAGRLASGAASTAVTVRLDEVRGGRNRGELTGRVSRESLEAAVAASS